jgi:hypothetical protein
MQLCQIVIRLAARGRHRHRIDIKHPCHRLNPLHHFRTAASLYYRILFYPDLRNSTYTRDDESFRAARGLALFKHRLSGTLLECLRAGNRQSTVTPGTRRRRLAQESTQLLRHRDLGRLRRDPLLLFLNSLPMSYKANSSVDSLRCWSRYKRRYLQLLSTTGSSTPKQPCNV